MDGSSFIGHLEKERKTSPPLVDFGEDFSVPQRLEEEYSLVVKVEGPL